MANSRDNYLTAKSKKLAWLLRHDKSYKFDGHGWRTIYDLVENQGFTFKDIEEIVRTDKKGRYEFNENKEYIRARQGHSVNVDVDLEEATPPDVLYHGTSKSVCDLISSTGIKKMNRIYVHLSSDVKTAINVGSRHGEPIVFEVNTKQMREDGIKFYKSRNGVWLTDFVDKKYIKVKQIDNTL